MFRKDILGCSRNFSTLSVLIELVIIIQCLLNSDRITYSKFLDKEVKFVTLVIEYSHAKLQAAVDIQHVNKLFPEALKQECLKAALFKRQTTLVLLAEA